MKQIGLMLLTLVLLTGTACEKEEIVPNRTIITRVDPGHWIPSENGRTWSAAINMPEIDDYFNENGGVLVYISFGDRTYEPLPQVVDGFSYYYQTRPGQLVLKLQNFDGSAIIAPPAAAITVKIILVQSV